MICELTLNYSIIYSFFYMACFKKLYFRKLNLHSNRQKYILLIMKYFAKLILVAVTILACSSCHKKDFPDNLTCIPQNATLVANVDLEKLIEKSNIKDFKTSGLYTLLNQEGQDQYGLMCLWMFRLHKLIQKN